MNSATTLSFLGLSVAIAILGLLSVRFPPAPGSWRGWLPSHYMLLTGLAGLLCFGIHWLTIYRQG